MPRMRERERKIKDEKRSRESIEGVVEARATEKEGNKTALIRAGFLEYFIDWAQRGWNGAGRGVNRGGGWRGMRSGGIARKPFRSSSLFHSFLSPSLCLSLYIAGKTLQIIDRPSRGWKKMGWQWGWFHRQPWEQRHYFKKCSTRRKNKGCCKNIALVITRDEMKKKIAVNQSALQQPRDSFSFQSSQDKLEFP